MERAGALATVEAGKSSSRPEDRTMALHTVSNDPNPIKECARCGLRYDWRRSPSSLKMTYCGSLCERADLGFTLDALLRFERPASGEELSLAA
jgi:hypothetical protein